MGYHGVMNHHHHVHGEKTEDEGQIYTCPMHPEIIRNAPGKCPGCGMDLILKGSSGEHVGHDMSHVSHVDHEAAMTNPQMAKKMEQDMRRRFLVSLLLSIPIFLYSPVGVNLFKLNLPTPIPINWLLLILTTPIVFWTGSIFITGTSSGLERSALAILTLIMSSNSSRILLR